MSLTIARIYFIGLLSVLYSYLSTFFCFMFFQARIENEAYVACEVNVRAIPIQSTDNRFCVHKSGLTFPIVRMQFLRGISMCIRYSCLNLSRILALDNEYSYAPETCRKNHIYANFHRHFSDSGAGLLDTLSPWDASSPDITCNRFSRPVKIARIAYCLEM